MDALQQLKEAENKYFSKLAEVEALCQELSCLRPELARLRSRVEQEVARTSPAPCSAAQPSPQPRRIGLADELVKVLLTGPKHAKELMSILHCGYEYIYQCAARNPRISRKDGVFWLPELGREPTFTPREAARIRIAKVLPTTAQEVAQKLSISTPYAYTLLSHPWFTKEGKVYSLTDAGRKALAEQEGAAA
jgi:hypothetical protein